MQPITSHLNELIESALARGETQMSLARRAGITRSQLCKWINGRASISIETADKIAAACHSVTT